MNVIVFEDSHVAGLSPIVTARPAFSITCGCLRLIDFLKSRHKISLLASVRPHLRTITQFNHPALAQQLDPSNSKTVVINARCVPCRANFDSIQKLLDGRTSDPTFDSLGEVAFGMIETLQLKDIAADDLAGEIKRIVAESSASAPATTLCLPHDVIRYNQEFFNENLELLIKQRGLSQASDGVFLAPDADVAQSVAFDTSDGPIIIDSKAKIKPFAYIQGPVYIGPNCTVNEHSAIKDFVCLTDTIKAGGEIEASIIEPFSNKQHHGFLGHSYLGSWINLGAGTCNSDLKNTYGKVTAVYGGEKVATGMQFVGCFIGDYSKSAINASIYTGKSIGVCSMLYGIVPTNVPSFVNYAKIFGQITEIPAEVMVTTQSRMFKRRKVEQRECDIQLMNDMFDMTSNERQSSGAVAGQLKF